MTNTNKYLRRYLNMDKATLMIIADILNTLDRNNRELYELLEILNVTPDEKEKVIDSIMVIAEKMEQIRRSNIKNLDDHIDINYVKNTNRY
jgi:flagellar biosynthesis/type III secretory pathway chaperone